LTYDLYSEETVSSQRYEVDSDNDPLQLREKRTSFSFDEDNNIRGALKAFYDALCGKRESNLEMAIRVTSVLESLYDN